MGQGGNQVHATLSEPPSGVREVAAIPGESVRLGGHILNLREVAEAYGREFTGRLLDEFTLKWRLAPATTNTKRIAALKRWLLDLEARAQPDTAQGRILDAFTRNRPDEISFEDFQAAVLDYVGRIQDPNDLSVVSTTSLTSRRPLLEVTLATLRALAPSVGWPKPPEKIAWRLGLASRGTTPSLGELERGDESTSRRPYKETILLNKQRLERLREIAEDELLLEWEWFEFGQNLLGRDDLPSAELLKEAELALDRVTILPNRRSPLPPPADVCFPLDDDDYQLGALLKHIQDNHTGRISGSDTWSTSGIRCLVRKFGGINDIARYLEASERALVAAYTIVLIDSGLNAGSLDQLPADPYIGGVRRGRIQLVDVAAVKNRPTPHNVFSVLGSGTVYTANKRQRVSGVEAIRIWFEMSASIRRRAEQERVPEELDSADGTRISARLGGRHIPDLMWIMPTGNSNAGPIRSASSGNFRDWWLSFLEDYETDPVIGGLPIRRKHIRPTLLQIAATDRGGDLGSATLLANHSSAAVTFQNYLNRPYVREILTDKVAHFQKLLQAAIMNNGSLHRALGQSDELHSSLFEEAKACGLEFITRFQSPSEPESSPSRDGTRAPIGYSDRDYALKSTAFLKVSLEQAASTFISMNPDRWVAIWLPLQAMTIAIANELREGSAGDRYHKIEQEVEQAVKNGRLPPFEPW